MSASFLAASLWIPVALGVAAQAAASAPDSAGAIRRFALVAGVNGGGAARTPLRYAQSDARGFAKVLEELGGVAPADELVLIEPRASELMAGLGRLREMLEKSKGAHQRLEVMLYYSGHSDEEGLLVGADRISYKLLREQLEALPAQVRVAIVDSCASGALTRRKGGTQGPPFLVDTSSQVTGQAILTSSAETEAAQESDRIGGSFFTHSLLTGLRGAADVSGDGRVTLTEAYQFAFDETLARTESTQAGAQHPNYDINLSGSGDLVMTDLRGTETGLRLDASLEGRLFVRDSNDRLVAELRKQAGRMVEIGLEPGAYRVTVARDGKMYRAELTLTRGEPAELTEFDLLDSDVELTASRGDEGRLGPRVSRTPKLNLDEYVERKFSLTVVPGLHPHDVVPPGRKLLKRWSVNLIYGTTDALWGAEVGALVNNVRERLVGFSAAGVAVLNQGRLDGIQLAGALNRVAGGGRGVVASGAVGFVGPGFQGVQLAGVANVNKGQLDGVQAAGALNWTIEGGKGVATAGAANVMRGSFRGIALAGGANVLAADAPQVLQLAGGANLVTGGMRGMQVAGGVNYSRATLGAQVALLNVTGDMRGTQLGVVNIATGRVRGLQLGLVNVGGEYESAIPVGLLSFAKNGQLHLDMWASDLMPVNLAIKTGSKHFYTLVAVGARGPASDNIRFGVLGVGVGGKVTMGEHLFAAVDGIFGELRRIRVHGTTIEDAEKRPLVHDEASVGDASPLAQLRLMVGYQLWEHVGAFAGLSVYTFTASHVAERYPFVADRKGIVARADNGRTLRIFPGLFAGVQL